MDNERNSLGKRIGACIHRTYKQKLFASLLVNFGCIATMLTGDGEFLGTTLFLGVPLFLCGRNLMDED